MRATAWQQAATRLGGLLPKARLHPAVVAQAETYRSEKIWAVAFSGGADSLALLLLVWAHWPERRTQLVALHFNHRLRGRESDADAAFCQRVCASLGIRLRVGQWRSARKGASEGESRVARHEFFVREMKRLGTEALWLAHQLDDIAESFFMRLARGSGTAGLAAPRPVQRVSAVRVHLRPLLTLRKAELVKALRLAGAAWREDSSNAGTKHFRNRIRGKVLPAWIGSAGRDALAGAALSRARLEEDDVALEAWLAQLKPLTRAGRLDLRRLAGMPTALIRRALHRWLLVQSVKTDLSRQGFEALLAAAQRGTPTRFSLGPTDFAVIRQGKLFCAPRKKITEGSGICCILSVSRAFDLS